MSLCVAVPLAGAFALIYRDIRQMEVSRVSGTLMQESARSSERIGASLWSKAKAQEVLSGLAAGRLVEGRKALGDFLVSVTEKDGDYEILCFIDGGRAIKACGGALRGAKPAAGSPVMERYAAGVALKRVYPWQFIDGGNGLTPVLVTRVVDGHGRAAGYLLGALKKDVLSQDLASFEDYYLHLRGVRLRYAAVAKTGDSYSAFALSAAFSAPLRKFEGNPSGSYEADGMITIWNFTAKAPEFRTYLQVPRTALYSGLREVRVIYFSLSALLLLGMVLLTVYIVKRSSRAVDALLKKLEEMSKGDYSRIDCSRFSGDRNIEHANALIDRLLAYEETSRREARLAALGKLAAQVAHDIRSPLAALTTALNDIVGSLPRDKRELAGGALGRIGRIAGELIDNYRKPGSAVKAASSQELGGLLTPLIAEVRAQHGPSGAAIELSAWKRVRAIVEPTEFGRMVSNLVNNAVEALEGKEGGEVRVELSEDGGRAILSVSDNGKGIPPDILPRLGGKDVTHGKAGGTGLGLYQARTAAEKWGGALKIVSEQGKGTRVIVELPACAVPKGVPVFLLDDDELVHMNWKIAAKAAGADLRAFTDPYAFTAALEKEARATPVYIDSELGGGAKGEEIAAGLHARGFTDLTMSTGRSPGEFAGMPWLKISDKEPPWA